MSGLLSLRCERHYGSDWTEDKRLDFSLDTDVPLSGEELCKSLFDFKSCRTESHWSTQRNILTTGKHNMLLKVT